MSARIRRTKVNVVSTTDGVTVTDIVVSDTMPDNSTFRSELVLIGKDGSNNSVSCKVSTRGKTAAGATALEGVLTTETAMAGNVLLTPAVPTMLAAGATVKGQVVGIAATTIEWTAWLTTYIN